MYRIYRSNVQNYGWLKCRHKSSYVQHEGWQKYRVSNVEPKLVAFVDMHNIMIDKVYSVINK